MRRLGSCVWISAIVLLALAEDGSETCAAAGCGEDLAAALVAFYAAVGQPEKAHSEAKARELLEMPKWRGREFKMFAALEKKYVNTHAKAVKNLEGPFVSYRDRFGYAGDRDVHALAPSLLNMLQCEESCPHGISDDDRKMAEMAAKKRGEPLEVHLSKVCLWRCQSKLAKAKSASQFEPEDGFWAYHHAASRCVSERGRIASEATASAVEVVQRCGVVHLEGLLGPDSLAKPLFARLSEAWRKLRDDETERKRRMDEDQLRAGRWEVWVPFEEPWNNTKVIAGSGLVKFLDALWPPGHASPVLDHVTVINSLPQAPTQPLHSDYLVPGEHLEVHIPLQDIVEAHGPTRFCPCTQRMAPSHNDGQAVKGGPPPWRFTSPAKLCDSDPTLGYADGSSLGAANIYDAAVVHGGTANTFASAEDRKDLGERPVLQLSFAMSPAAMEERGYVRRASEGGLAGLAEAEASSFRTAFASARGAGL